MGGVKARWTLVLFVFVCHAIPEYDISGSSHLSGAAKYSLLHYSLEGRRVPKNTGWPPRFWQSIARLHLEEGDQAPPTIVSPTPSITIWWMVYGSLLPLVMLKGPREAWHRLLRVPRQRKCHLAPSVICKQQFSSQAASAT